MLLSEYKKQMAGLLSIRDQLRDVHVPQPQMCVVGDQSSGKSSLLQCLTGIPFPVHHGTCTKAPIVVECREAEEIEFQFADAEGQWWSTDDPEEVAAAILKIQESMLDETAISEKEIRVTASGPHLVDMVVVDLPGIIHNGAGKEETVRLIDKYIQPVETLIILVSEAKADAESLAAQALAEKYDPQGTRTLKVLTKFDTFDTDAAKERAIQWILDGESDPLGPHGVVCRPNGNSYTSGKERSAFTESNSNRFGVQSLVQRLPGLYSELIKSSIPSLWKAVTEEYGQVTTQLKKIGTKPPERAAVLGAAQTKLREGVIETQELVSESLELLKEKVSDLESVITTEWCTDSFKVNVLTTPFFKGEAQYNACIQELALLCQEPADEFVAEVQSIFGMSPETIDPPLCKPHPKAELENGKIPPLAITDEKEGRPQKRQSRQGGRSVAKLDNTFSPKFKSTLHSAWSANLEKEVSRFKDAINESVRRLGKHGSMDERLVSIFLKKRPFPSTLENQLVASLAKYQKYNSTGSAFGGSGGHNSYGSHAKDVVADLKQAWEETDEADFQTVVKENVTAAVQSHFEVGSTTMLDVILQDTTSLLEWQDKWINDIVLEATIIDAAKSEHAGIPKKRSELVSKKGKLKECIRTLNSL